MKIIIIIIIYKNYSVHVEEKLKAFFALLIIMIYCLVNKKFIMMGISAVMDIVQIIIKIKIITDHNITL